MENIIRNYKVYKNSQILTRVQNPVKVEEQAEYVQIGIRSHAKGIFIKEPVVGKELGNKRVFWVEEDCFIVNIVFAWERAIAQTNSELKGLIASHRFPMYRVDNSQVDLDYFTRLFQTNRGKYLLELASPGGAGRNKTLGQKEFNELEIKLPSLETQKYVSRFLNLLDHRIEQQNEKVEAWREYRKGMMQKLFSQKLRFKDEDGRGFPEWETSRLGELGETFTGLSGKTKEDFGDGEAEFVTFMNVFGNVKAKRKQTEKVDLSDGKKQNPVILGDVLFTTSSETPHEVGMASVWLFDEPNVYLNSFCFGFRLTNSNISSEYLVYMLRSETYRKKITLLAQGSTRFNLPRTELLNMNIEIPKSTEQRKISKLLSTIDNKIEMETKKAELLQEQKKGFIQQMFI